MQSNFLFLRGNKCLTFVTMKLGSYFFKIFLILILSASFLLKENLLAQDLFQQALANFEQENFEEAQKYFSMHLTLHPNDEVALYNRAISYYYYEKKLNALTDFYAILKINEQHQQAQQWCAKILHEIGLVNGNNSLYSFALDDFDLSLQFQPDQHDILFEKGKTLRLLSEPELAIQSFTKAIILSPQPNYYYARAITYLKLEKPTESLTDLNEYLKQVNEDTSALWIRATLLYEREKYQEAKEDLVKLQYLKHNNRAVQDLVFANNFSLFIHTNFYWIIAFLLLLLIGIFLSIMAIIRK